MYPARSISTPIGAALACVASVTVLAGCGRSEQEQVREVVENYIQTVARRDFDATCDLLTAGYRHQLGGRAECIEAQHAQFGPETVRSELQIAAVGVNGSRANAGLTVSREGAGAAPYTLLLVRNREGRWRIRGQQ